MQDEDDDPYKPTVTLGYNTESQVQKSLSETDKEEARWNYAFWLQNDELCFGLNDTADDVKQWILESGFTIYGDNDNFSDAQYIEMEKITEAFIAVLIDIVKELHEDGVLKNKFKKELPIIIHELEYYDEIALQNIDANGEYLPDGFVAFCGE